MHKKYKIHIDKYLKGLIIFTINFSQRRNSKQSDPSLVYTK